MNRNHSGASYSTVAGQDDVQGWAAVELYRLQRGEKERVARIVYWDATGHFWLETSGVEIPLDIIEELIAEAKAIIKIR